MLSMPSVCARGMCDVHSEGTRVAVRRIIWTAF